MEWCHAHSHGLGPHFLSVGGSCLRGSVRATHMVWDTTSLNGVLLMGWCSGHSQVLGLQQRGRERGPALCGVVHQINIIIIILINIIIIIIISTTITITIAIITTSSSSSSSSSSSLPLSLSPQ
eukprot:4792348-Pyramimonas_sp.AAC.1